MIKFKYIFLLAVAVAIGACKSGSKLDRSIVPAAGPAPVIKIGQYQLATLDNGLRLVVVENHKLPRVSYNINLDIDPIVEGSKAGYSSLAGDLMAAGTKTRSKSQIDESIDFMGASLSSSSTGVFGSCLKKHSDEFLSLMSDVLLNPTFPKEEFDKSIKQTLSGLANEKTDPNSMSDKVGNAMKYGKDHPYGEVMTESTVNAITREDLVSYYETYFRPNVSYLIVVGDITFEEAKAQANQHFASWKKQPVKESAFKMPSAPDGNRVVFVPLAGAVQSVIDVTYAIDLKPGTNDAIVASVLNNILGGSGFQTRLMQNLREDKAYTYGAYSVIAADENVGYFSAGASVRNAVTDSAITELLFEMKRLVDAPVADSTLQTVKNIMNGSFARSLERPQTVANFALNIEKYKLPKDYYETYLQKLQAVTVADVQAMAMRIIKPSNAFITVVGNREVSDKLGKFAKGGKVEIVNADGSPFVELKPAPEGLTTANVFEKHIMAMGGVDALKKVKSFEQKGKMSMGPMALDMNIRVKDSKKFRMTVSMAGQEFVKQVYDGNKGLMVQGPQKQEMDQDMIAEIKQQMDLLAEMNYDKNGIISVLKGIDIIDGQSMYVIELKKANGSVVTEYYQVQTGLKFKSVSVSEEEGETVVAETIYKEYAKTGDIMFPSKMTQIAGPQTIDLSVDEMILNPKLDDKDFSIE
jgi:predicted Zn-dependent peptidase